MVFINKSKVVRDNPADILEKMLAQDKVFFIGKPEDSNPCIWSLANYWSFKRSNLSSCSKAEFIENLTECFENIHFTESVVPSLNTLNNEFSDMRYEIVEHLNKLDYYYYEFQRKCNENIDNRTLCLSFKEFSGIECSPQAGSDSVHTLSRKF